MGQTVFSKIVTKTVLIPNVVLEMCCLSMKRRLCPIPLNLGFLWHLPPPRAHGEKDTMWLWRQGDQNVMHFLLVLLKWSLLVIVCMVWGNPSSRCRAPHEELEPLVHSPGEFSVGSTNLLVTLNEAWLLF